MFCCFILYQIEMLLNVILKYRGRIPFFSLKKFETKNKKNIVNPLKKLITFRLKPLIFINRKLKTEFLNFYVILSSNINYFSTERRCNKRTIINTINSKIVYRRKAIKFLDK